MFGRWGREGQSDLTPDQVGHVVGKGIQSSVDPPLEPDLNAWLGKLGITGAIFRREARCLVAFAGDWAIHLLLRGSALEDQVRSGYWAALRELGAESAEAAQMLEVVKSRLQPYAKVMIAQFNRGGGLDGVTISDEFARFLALSKGVDVMNASRQDDMGLIGELTALAALCAPAYVQDAMTVTSQVFGDHGLAPRR
jgi:hypothetical protein